MKSDPSDDLKDSSPNSHQSQNNLWGINSRKPPGSLAGCLNHKHASGFQDCAHQHAALFVRISLNATPYIQTVILTNSILKRKYG